MFTYCHIGLLGTEIAIKNAINLLQGSTHFTEPQLSLFHIKIK